MPGVTMVCRRSDSNLLPKAAEPTLGSSYRVTVASSSPRAGQVADYVDRVTASLSPSLPLLPGEVALTLQLLATPSVVLGVAAPISPVSQLERQKLRLQPARTDESESAF